MASPVCLALYCCTCSRYSGKRNTDPYRLAPSKKFTAEAKARFRIRRRNPLLHQAIIAAATEVQAFTATAFQAALVRGEIPPETDIKLLLDFLYGYSLFRLITEQIDDDEIPDRIGAAIVKLARSGVPNPAGSENRSRIRRIKPDRKALSAKRIAN